MSDTERPRGSRPGVDLSRRYDVDVTADNAARFEEWLADDTTNCVDRLWRHVAPDMSGRRRARTATLLMLASEGDRGGFRGRLHVLLYDEDEGGTGKSALGEWVKREMPDAHGCGPGSSEAGLKYNANTGQPGKLAMAHRGVLRIEEFEKFSRNDRKATYESMSEGYFEVDKGGVNTEFPAEVRVLAMSNSPGAFDGPLMDRFDFAIEMEEYDAEETITIGKRRYEVFRDNFVREEHTGSEALLPQFLSYIGGFRPGYPDSTHQRIVSMLDTLVREADQEGEIRQKEAYIRCAYTIAKLNLRDITPEDWAYAVDIMHPDIDAAELFDL